MTVLSVSRNGLRHGWAWIMDANWNGTRGTLAGSSNHDNHDDLRNGGSSGEKPPGVGAVGNDAVSHETGRAGTALSNRRGVRGDGERGVFGV